MRLPIKAQIRTYKNVKCVHIIKCAKLRALFAKNKVRFARADCGTTMERIKSITHNVTEASREVVCLLTCIDAGNQLIDETLQCGVRPTQTKTRKS